MHDKPMGTPTETLKSPPASARDASDDDPAPLRAVDHVCYVFLPFATIPDRLPNQLTRSLGDIGADAGAKPWLPDAARATLDDRPVWQAGALHCSNDLHPQVRRLLGVDAAGDAERGASAFVLTQEARKLLAGIPYKFAPLVPPGLRAPKTLELTLSRAARERLASRLGTEPPAFLSIAIDGVRLVHFRTGHAIVVAEIRCLPGGAEAVIPAAWLIEIVAALGHVDQLRWHRDDRDPPVDFTIADVLTSLVGGETRASFRRLFCYTVASFAESLTPSARGQLGAQLCRRYTDDHRIDGVPQGTYVAQPFANVIHAFGVEGGATIVDECRRSEFLSHYRSAAVEQTYLPIVLLNYHEFVHLLAISQESGLWPSLDHLDKRQIEQLQTLKHAIMAFRLFYRFTYVSLIGPHNVVHTAIRSALQLDRMLGEVSSDVVEIHSFLREIDAERHEARFRLAAVVATAAIAFLTSNTILTELIEPLVQHPDNQCPADGSFMQMAVCLAGKNSGLIAAVAAVLVAAATGFITWRKLSGDSRRHGEGPLEHAIQETIVHRAKRGP